MQVGIDPKPEVSALAQSADRLDALADAAELMGDAAGAVHYREQAYECRERAMTMLDG